MAKFWERVDKRGDCWLWTGAINNHGYGNVSHQGKYWKAHRLAWALTHGDIPPGMQVLHRCDNPPCVRPDHLWLGTHTDNMRDRAEKGRHSVGNRRGSRHPLAKLTETDVRTIRDSLLGSMSHREIAERYGVTPNNIYRIATRKSWRHI